MLKSSSPPVGAIAFGRSGRGFPVIEIEDNRLVLERPQGNLRVPLSAIIRWEYPPQPKVPTVGDRVRLKFTERVYQVLEVSEHLAMIQDGEKEYEPWAKLRSPVGEIAHWKLCQLEKIANQ